MCGIVGVAGNISKEEYKMFKDMLLMDQIRGMDSTGVVLVDAYNGSYLIDKIAGTPVDLFNYGREFGYDGLPKTNLTNILIGHNRAATMGKVNDSNAHPFEHDSVAGVHNGTLYLWDKLENYKENDVDSLSLIQHISKHGINDAWGKFYGAAAVVWYDEENKTLNFARNSRRPLFYIYNKKKDVVFWASEPFMIIEAAKRFRVPIALDTNKKGNPRVYEVPEDTHISFVVDRWGVKKNKNKKLIPMKVETRTFQQNKVGFKIMPEVPVKDRYWEKDCTITNKLFSKAISKIKQKVHNLGLPDQTFYYSGDVMIGDEERKINIHPDTDEDKQSFNWLYGWGSDFSEEKFFISGDVYEDKNGVFHVSTSGVSFLGENDGEGETNVCDLCQSSMSSVNTNYWGDSKICEECYYNGNLRKVLGD